MTLAISTLEGRVSYTEFQECVYSPEDNTYTFRLSEGRFWTFNADEYDAMLVRAREAAK